jgi:cytochrome c-type biogenesis protein CcmI
MGLFKLLTFPVSGPVMGARWIMQTLLDEAERQYYDPAAIRQQMADLEAEYRAGRVDEDEFDRREEELLERLLEARAFLRRKQMGQPPG